MLTKRTGWLESHRPRYTRRFISQNVTKRILRHNDIEESGLCQHTHRSIVDEHIIRCHLRILRFHFFSYLTPQTARCQHISLIDYGQVLMALHSHFEGHLEDALNLGTRIDISVEGHIVVLMLLTKIHTACQFTNDHEIGTTQQFFLQRRLMQQAVERSYRTDVGKQSQLLAHGQQTRLRTHLQRGIIVVFQVAHGSKQHGISTHTDIMRRIRIGIATGINGTGTNQCFFVFELVTAFLSNSVEYSHTLFHYLRADTITSQYCNFQFHIVISLNHFQ